MSARQLFHSDTSLVVIVIARFFVCLSLLKAQGTAWLFFGVSSLFVSNDNDNKKTRLLHE